MLPRGDLLLSRPARPAMTSLEHDLAHAATGLRTAASVISQSRGAYSPSATAAERTWRTVSVRWVQRQHDALGCGKTLGAAKRGGGFKRHAMRQNDNGTDNGGPRIDRPVPPEVVAGVQAQEAAAPANDLESTKGAQA